MKSDFVNARNTITNVIATVPSHYLGDPVLGQYLELADKDAECIPCQANKTPEDVDTDNTEAEDTQDIEDTPPASRKGKK